MFEYYISSVLFIIILYYIYHKYFIKKYIEGEWLEINKDISIGNKLNWDISSNSKVKIVNFSSWKKYFLGQELYIQLKEKESLFMKFINDEDSDCILDVCDQKMKSIHRIIDPGKIIFSCVGREDHYLLEKNKKYIFFLRNNFLDKEVKTILRKYRNIDKLNKSVKRIETQFNCVDEKNIEPEYISKSYEIVEAMKKRGYRLVSIEKSDQYLSYPSNTISNKISLEVELGNVLILLCSNKEKTCGMINHFIEINSTNNNLNWYPDDDENISHLLLNNCDQFDKFTFYERMTNISNGSNIIPFCVLTFTNIKND